MEEYSGLTHNPFANTPGALGEIWAIGFRNPYTFDIDKVTENMYVSDIGQHDWEEVNHVFAGENYGWPDCEGPCGDTSYVEPIYTYDHTEGCSITGAAFYRESQFPAIYEGSFFFADFCSNWIRRIDTQGMVTDFGTDVAGGPVD
ncbi:MAG: PQQ-dependent sugar dehydrogenase, partial [Ignavibacteria bacterium]|nr:PQQ-dependent sugar dehydrogenase [Ignavibacteria bacterium]